MHPVACRWGCLLAALVHAACSPSGETSPRGPLSDGLSSTSSDSSPTHDTASSLRAPTAATAHTADTAGATGGEVDVGPYYPPAVAILPLGDSITAGGYRYDLWTRLVDSGFSFDFIGSEDSPPDLDGEPHVWPPYAGLAFDANHEGHPGWTSGHILAAPAWDADQGTLPDWLTDYTPDIALVHLGTNDAFYELDRATVASNLAAIIDALRADNPNVVVFLARIVPLDYPYWNSSHDTYDFLVQDYNAAIDELAARTTRPESPVWLVDHYTGFDGVADTYDLIHPDASGDVKMAEAWHAALVTKAEPITAADAYGTSQGVLEIEADDGLLANDRSLTGSLTASLLEPPQYGAITLFSDGAFVYTPAPAHPGTDRFTYVASDGMLSSDPVTVEICVGELGGGDACDLPR